MLLLQASAFAFMSIIIIIIIMYDNNNIILYQSSINNLLSHSVLSMVVPIYNAELAPKSLRGRLVSLNQLAITAGIMVYNIKTLDNIHIQRPPLMPSYLLHLTPPSILIIIVMLPLHMYMYDCRRVL